MIEGRGWVSDILKEAMPVALDMQLLCCDSCAELSYLNIPTLDIRIIWNYVGLYTSALFRLVSCLSRA